jgi:hypothetical protein
MKTTIILTIHQGTSRLALKRRIKTRKTSQMLDQKNQRANQKDKFWSTLTGALFS